MGSEGMETFQRSSGTVTPVPDPTSLTTAQLYREIATIEATVKSEIGHLKELLIQRMDLMESQRVELKNDTNDALANALTAAREARREQDASTEKANAKAETVMTKGLEELGKQFDAKYDSFDHQLQDTKASIGKIENLKQGGKEARDNTAAIVGLVLTLLVIADLIYTFSALR